MKRLLLPLLFAGILSAPPVRAQLVESVSGEPVTTYNPGFAMFGLPPSLQSQATATPLPAALDLTGVGVGTDFTIELRAPANGLFTFTPEAASPATSVEFRFRWFQFGVNIGGTALNNMLTAPSAEWINASGGAPTLATSTDAAFAYYQSSNNASNIQIVANATASGTFTFEGIRFRATWAVDPNDVSVNWNEGGYLNFSDSNYSGSPTGSLLTVAPIPEPREVGILLGGALCLLIAARTLTSRARRRATA